MEKNREELARKVAEASEALRTAQAALDEVDREASDEILPRALSLLAGLRSRCGSPGLVLARELQELVAACPWIEVRYVGLNHQPELTTAVPEVRAEVVVWRAGKGGCSGITGTGARLEDALDEVVRRARLALALRAVSRGGAGGASGEGP